MTMTSASDWQSQTGRSWAENYALTDRALSGLTRQIVERLAVVPGRTIADIGCGAGETALILARTRPEASVLGLDISPDLITIATQRGAGMRNLLFQLADASVWQAGVNRPDLLVSRHGVMFFDDPVAAFCNLATQAEPGAELAFSCFRDPSLNPWASGIVKLLGLPSPADPHAPGPFAFADAKRVETILVAAGWQDVAFEPIDFRFITGQGMDPVMDSLEFLTRIGPAAVVLRDMDDTEKSDAFSRIGSWLHDFRQDKAIAIPAAAWWVRGRKAA